MTQRTTYQMVATRVHNMGLWGVDRNSAGFRIIGSSDRFISPRLKGKLIMIWLDAYEACREDLRKKNPSLWPDLVGMGICPTCLIKNGHTTQCKDYMKSPLRKVEATLPAPMFEEHARSAADPEREWDDSTRVCVKCGEPWPCTVARRG